MKDTRMAALWLTLLWLLIPLLAHGALPGGELWRENITNRAVGYGHSATGGKGGTLCTVSTLSNTGAGSLRNCLLQSGAQWIIFSVSGTINLTSSLVATGSSGHSNKTIDGRGATITVASTGDGFVISNISNWILTNITVTCGGFCIRMIGGSNTILLDHLTIPGTTGSNAVTTSVGSSGGENSNASYNITYSWNHFHTQGVSSGMILIGSDPSNTEMVDSTVSMHHNWYDNTRIRHPKGRYAKMHSFNNYFDHTNSAIQITADGRALSENDIFEGQSISPDTCPNCYPRMQCLQSYGNVSSEALAANCHTSGQWSVVGDETYEEVNAGTIFNPASDYTYTLETANAALRTKITSQSGVQALANPVVTITAPTSGTTTSTGTTPLTTLAGTATDTIGVTSVTWSCPTCTPTSGTATCATCGPLNSQSVTWSVASIGLASGANVLTVTAFDDENGSSTDTLTVTLITSAAPTATITAPTSGTTYSTSTTPLTTLAGTAADDVGVTSVTWSCPTCTPTSGTATCGTCGASATAPAWSVASLGLGSGDNVITVQAQDAELQTGSDTLTVTYTLSASAPVVLRLVK
jgi:pectate lyase